MESELKGVDPDEGQGSRARTRDERELRVGFRHEQGVSVSGHARQELHTQEQQRPGSGAQVDRDTKAWKCFQARAAACEVDRAKSEAVPWLSSHSG